MSPLLLALVLLAAAAEPTPTPAGTAVQPTPTPPINILLSRQGSGESGGQDLASIAKRIKLKLPAGQPRRLDNEAVKQLSQGVELTQVKKSIPSGGLAGGSGDADRDDATKERFWVALYQAARGYVKGLQQLVPQLDGEVNRLRTEFYSTDDPARRDGVIKPAWDKALADWQQATKELAEAPGLVDKVRDAAFKDGALPGWFRGLPEPEAALSKPVIPETVGGGEGQR